MQCEASSSYVVGSSHPPEMVRMRMLLWSVSYPSGVESWNHIQNMIIHMRSWGCMMYVPVTKQLYMHNISTIFAISVLYMALIPNKCFKSFPEPVFSMHQGGAHGKECGNFPSMHGRVFLEISIVRT